MTVNINTIPCAIDNAGSAKRFAKYSPMAMVSQCDAIVERATAAKTKMEKSGNQFSSVITMVWKDNPKENAVIATVNKNIPRDALINAMDCNNNPDKAREMTTLILSRDGNGLQNKIVPNGAKAKKMMRVNHTD